MALQRYRVEFVSLKVDAARRFVCIGQHLQTRLDWLSVTSLTYIPPMKINLFSERDAQVNCSSTFTVTTSKEAIVTRYCARTSNRDVMQQNTASRPLRNFLR